VVGVFVPEDPSAADDLAKEGKFGFEDGWTKVILHP
jgi:hypothetical protein